MCFVSEVGRLYRFQFALVVIFGIYREMEGKMTGDMGCIYAQIELQTDMKVITG